MDSPGVGVTAWTCCSVAVGDIPHFGFGISAEGGGDFFGRVDLDGEVIAGVEDFDEEGEAVAGESGAEDFFAVVLPEVVEGFSGEGAF